MCSHPVICLAGSVCQHTAFMCIQTGLSFFKSLLCLSLEAGDVLNGRSRAPRTRSGAVAHSELPAMAPRPYRRRALLTCAIVDTLSKPKPCFPIFLAPSRKNLDDHNTPHATPQAGKASLLWTRSLRSIVSQ